MLNLDNTKELFSVDGTYSVFDAANNMASDFTPTNTQTQL